VGPRGGGPFGHVGVSVKELVDVAPVAPEEAPWRRMVRTLRGANESLSKFSGRA
jgi:hypothetical protein